MVVEKITEKKAELGLDLGIAYLVPVLSHKTTQTHTWRFFFSFWHPGEHTAVPLLVCNSQTWADGSLLGYSS